MDPLRPHPPSSIATIPQVVVQHTRTDTQVPKVETVLSAAILPADRVFVAQVVTARLSGSAYPDSPVEIVPPERRLKPYDLPMLPTGKKDAETVSIKADRESVPAASDPSAATLNRPPFPGFSPVDDTDMVHPEVPLAASTAALLTPTDP